MEDDAGIDEWIAYRDAEPTPTEERRGLDALTIVAVDLGVVTVIAMILLRPTGEARRQVETLASIGVPSQFHAAEIVDIERAPCQGVPTSTCLTVNFELQAGPDVGYVFQQSFTEGGTLPDLQVGDTAILSYIAPNARVDDARNEPCEFDATQECRTLTLVVDGEPAPTVVDYQLFPGDIGGALTIGDRAVVDFFSTDGDEPDVLSVSPVDPDRQYQLADIQRRGTLVWLAIVFAAVVIALSGWRGFAALGGLMASVVILLVFILPAILDGRSPVLVAVVGSAAIAYLALYLAHGFQRMTTVALLGTLGALALTAVLSAVAVDLAEFTGLVTEESTLLTLFETIDVRGLLLAGIVLGAAGAIDDVTVTQASAVWELKAVDPTLEPRTLFRRGLRIGRDHIASTVNTLLLAYAGAALPLMVLFVLSQQSLGTVANSEVVAVEIVRTIVGSIGLVAAVPFTTWLAARTADGSSVEGGHGHA
jgi:uncharacterized membrane protein